MLADEDFCTYIKARLSRPENTPLTSDVTLLAVRVLGLRNAVQTKQATCFKGTYSSVKLTNPTNAPTAIDVI